ncbi:MAG: hypothetical protein GY707_05175 [Desulfobacteraceae bacterium]|nr:hypothetical protein [Desulfobacteraceae bacterium]
MAINLSRNTKMYVSTVSASAASVIGDFTNLNTWEVPVLDGYSFSQDVETQDVTLNESGCTPVRGQKVFNTALNPVEVSFPTYIKPYNDSSNSNMVERILWNAFIGGNNDYITAGNPSADVDFYGSDTNALVELTLIFVLDTTAYMVTGVTVGSVEVDFAIDAIATLNWAGQGSKIIEFEDATDFETGVNYTAEPTGAAAPQFIKNKLSQVTIFEDTNVATDGYQTVDYARNLVGSDALTTTIASYNFNLKTDTAADQQITVDLTGDTDIDDVIISINAGLTTATAGATASIVNGNIQITSDTVAGSGATVEITQGAAADSAYLFLQLATAAATFKDVLPAQDGLDPGTQYDIPITGGSITLENNVTFLTPEELGKVNIPLSGGFSGTRAFSGTLNAYLNTGTTRSGGLLAKLTDENELKNVTNRYWVKVAVGGTCTANSTHVDFIMPFAQLTIPTFNVEDVLSTEIGFTAVGSDITQPDELYIEYHADLT